MKHSSSNSTSVAGTFTYDKGTSAGDYSNPYWYFTPNDTTNYNSASGYVSGTVTISKVAASVTAAPTKKSSLTYNRSTQALVNAGTASGGTMYYKYTTTNSKPTSTSGFSSSIPTRTDAGTYYVWYYVYGDSNHTDTNISSTAISVTIAKATPVINTAPSKATGLSYTGSAQNLLTGGSVKHSSSDSASVSGTFTYAKGTNAGTYNSLTWSFAPSSSNYNSISGTVSGSVTIDKASRTISFTSHPYSLYVGKTRQIAVSVSAGEDDGTITLSCTYGHVSFDGMNVTGISAGGEYITATISEGTNYLSVSVRYSPTVYDDRRHGVTITETFSNSSYISTSGSEISKGVYKTTGFINVTPGEHIRFRSSGSKNVLCFSAYTQNSQSSIVLSECKTGDDDGVTNFVVDYDITIPVLSGINYIRICNDNRVLVTNTVDIYFV